MEIKVHDTLSALRAVLAQPVAERKAAYQKYMLETSVGQYIILEGLAESFAKALYGEEFVSPWVTSLSDEEMEQSRTIIGRDINVMGFDKIRSYLRRDTDGCTGC
jgi:uncharacterized protein YjaZ